MKRCTGKKSAPARISHKGDLLLEQGMANLKGPIGISKVLSL